MFTRWARLQASSLVSREVTWVLMVLGATNRTSAISLLDWPWATSASTSRSRGLNPFGGATVAGAFTPSATGASGAGTSGGTVAAPGEEVGLAEATAALAPELAVGSN